MVYCESALEIYDVVTAKWIQTIPFRKVWTLATCILDTATRTTFISYITFPLSLSLTISCLSFLFPFLPFSPFLPPTVSLLYIFRSPFLSSLLPSLSPFLSSFLSPS